MHTVPTVSTTLYLDNSWHRHAHESEVYLDIKEKAVDEQRTLMAAYKTGAKPKRKAARREASAPEKREYAKQCGKAKKEEFKSWAEENDIYNLIDIRKQKVPN